MGVLRNFIDIEGLSSYDELPKEIDGQVVQISECENISLPAKNINIRNIYQLLIDIQITSSKNIKTPINTLVVLDGVKKFKIIYYDEQNKVGILDINVPFNTFIELKDKDEEFKSAKVYVLDGFFQLLHKNILYSHLLYHINVLTSSSENNIQVENMLVDSTYTPNEYLNSLPLKDMDIYYSIPPELKVLTKERQSTAGKTSNNYNLHNELSISEDISCNIISHKINAPTAKEEPLLIDKFHNFIYIDEEYIYE